MPAGRPPIWDDPEAFANKVEEYFETEKTVTWSGLAIYLGFESRQSLEDYKSKPEFSYPIKKALLRIEQKYELAMMKQPAGAIFALKNFGWKDKQEVENKTTIEDNRIDLKKLSDEDLDQLERIQLKGREG
tara:strand:+ start:132 stop:524 length:393 start_codon:yes stop_codon:yes gene_type:complete